MNRKFYKTTYTITVISEGQLPEGLELSGIEYEITEGDSSGSFEETECIELSGLEAATELIAQGSDPEFFRLDEDGNSLEDED